MHTSHTHIRIHMTYLYPYTYAHMHIHMHIHIHIHTLYTFTHAHAHTHIHTYIYTHTCTHAHIHIHMFLVNKNINEQCMPKHEYKTKTVCSNLEPISTSFVITLSSNSKLQNPLLHYVIHTIFSNVIKHVQIQYKTSRM